MNYIAVAGEKKERENSWKGKTHRGSRDWKRGKRKLEKEGGGTAGLWEPSIPLYEKKFH